MWYDPVIHYFGSSIGTPDTLIPFLSMYTCDLNSIIFSQSATSCSEYLNVSTHPRILGRMVTPSGMHGNAIANSICFCEDLSNGCFHFPFSIVVDGPNSWHASSYDYAYDIALVPLFVALSL
jgi:hypothetical protein